MMARMKPIALVALTLLSVPSLAVAACPASPPKLNASFVSTDDQRVSSSWLKRTLAGKSLEFRDGTERYHANGSYSYTTGSGDVFKAPGYRFYDTGQRCIDYANGPRFDLYVVRNKRLVLVNGGGESFVGRVGK